MKIATNKSLLLLFLTVILLSSCATSRMYTTLDILRPAEVTFAKDVNRILIVNNSVPQADNVGHFNLLLPNGNNNPEIVKFDSAAIFCNARLREDLEETGFFNSVQALHTSQNSSNNFYKTTPLDNNKINALCYLYNVDAIISLDKIETGGTLGEYHNESNEIFSALDVKIKTDWSIHHLNPTSIITKTYTDEFSWENWNVKNLPNRYDALVDASLLTGTNVAERFIPFWEKQDRYFYNPKNKLMRQAMDSVFVKKWDAAIQLWQKVADESKRNNLKFYATNNIAIAYEIIGNIEKALYFCNQAITIYPEILIYNFSEDNTIYNLMDYLSFLKKREDELILIEKQLGNY